MNISHFIVSHGDLKIYYISVPNLTVKPPFDDQYLLKMK